MAIGGDEARMSRLYHKAKVQGLCLEALERGWILVDTDSEMALFTNGFRAGLKLDLTIEKGGGVRIDTPGGYVVVEFKEFERLPTPKVVAELVAALR